MCGIASAAFAISQKTNFVLAEAILSKVQGRVEHREGVD
jgi:hypothetical protein